MKKRAKFRVLEIIHLISDLQGKVFYQFPLSNLISNPAGFLSGVGFQGMANPVWKKLENEKLTIL